MRKLIALSFFLGLTGCACARTKEEDILRTALKDTNRKLTYSRDQNEAYSRALRIALSKKKGK